MSEIIKSKERGSLIVISGPSGSGKGTVIQKYLEEHKKDTWLSISCTSRDMRPGDEEGQTYFFISKEDFLNKIDKGEFLEYANYNGNYYGTPKEHIEEKLAKGIDVILEIEVQGALKVKEKLPETICIFIMPPSILRILVTTLISCIAIGLVVYLIGLTTEERRMVIEKVRKIVIDKR